MSATLVLVRRASLGQSAVEMALVLGLLGALGVTAAQAASLGLTEWKVQHAARVAALSATADMVASDGKTPCWAVAGGLQNSGQLEGSPVCQAVVQSLGGLDPDSLSLALRPADAATRVPGAVAMRVIVTYREPVFSPLLRLLVGDTFTATGEATAWAH